ncbi:MAG TPA: ABC transporter ATP-binding protein [Thermoplasmataceae archaeon]|nr:ABC transporter ATP-binding protein [Thermoplasmatales archaeon AK]HLH86330.1 ABC transporter ATP-binding protein [Thermoplasmataceae archaeon]
MIEIRDLTVRYGDEKNGIIALDHVSFKIKEGKNFGIVGESGSGKSTLALAIMRLLPKNSKIISGQIIFDGTDILGLKESNMRQIRGKDISMIFQGAMNTLNPLMRIEDQVAEPLLLHGTDDQEEALEAARRSLSLVGLDDKVWKKYPHELSGGMKQRAVIAAAIVSNPKVLIADEPTTALDVITQVMITNLLSDLQRRLNMTVIFISHDFPLVSQFSDLMAILYGGKVCESGPNSEILQNAGHPYTKGLRGSVPVLGGQKTLLSIPGEPVNLRSPPSGCRFITRCAYATRACESYQYSPFSMGSDHTVYCTIYGG